MSSSFEVATALNSAPPSAPKEAENEGPPTSWVMIADWCNVFAGIFLELAFIVGAFMIFGPKDFSDGNIAIMNAFFAIEGALYAIAGFFMVGIMAKTPPMFGGGAGGCMQFAVLMLGGVFFALSSLTNPGCITSPSQVFDAEPCIFAGKPMGPLAWNAMAHYGISCFMGGTAYGFNGVLPLPKNDIFSPFWGVTMYFMGAWTIGIFKIWGPVFTGIPADPTSPVPWYFACLGTAFLTLGALILLKLDLDRIRG